MSTADVPAGRQCRDGAEDPSQADEVLYRPRTGGETMKRIEGGVMERIVVGVDGSQPSQVALRWAAEEARRRSASLEVVHAWHLPHAGGYPYLAGYLDLELFEADARRVVDLALAGEELHGLTWVHPILVQDGAARALLDTAKGAELLVVGSRGRGGFTGLLLGSVSQQVAAHAPCPVVIVPA
jgi:nucleotide-binding universal stress UspA family protein